MLLLDLDFEAHIWHLLHTAQALDFVEDGAFLEFEHSHADWWRFWAVSDCGCLCGQFEDCHNWGPFTGTRGHVLKADYLNA